MGLVGRGVHTPAGLENISTKRKDVGGEARLEERSFVGR